MIFSLLQMGSGGMMPGFDWGSVWVLMVLPSIIVGGIIVILVFLFLHKERASPSPAAGFSSLTSLHASHDSSNPPSQPAGSILGDVFRSLAPTLMDDEKRVMDELTRAKGEVLQSDLPELTNFSKATVSKVIHSLEVRGIVLREKHKWTYWCKINPRLVERVQKGELTVPSDQNPEPVGA